MENVKISDRAHGEPRRISKSFVIIAAAILLLALAAVRAIDIYRAAADADVMASRTLVTALGIAESILSVLAIAFSGGVLIYVSDRAGKKSSLLCAALFSFAVALDRAFYVAYSVATGVRTFLPEAGPSAYIRIASDVLAAVAAYFAASLVYPRIKKKKDDASPYGCALFASVLTLFQLAYQTYVTIDFHLTYDDVTSSERYQIIGDYMFILLKYGVVTFGAAIFAYRAAQHIFKRKKDKS